MAERKDLDFTVSAQELPDIDSMLNEGVPIWTCFRLWKEMMRARERGPEYWWERVREVQLEASPHEAARLQ
jgi:hypothetical protein